MGYLNLIGAGQAKSVEDWDENVSWDEQAQEVGAAQEPVLRPKGVHFRRRPQDGHSRLESGQKGQGDGQAAHGAVSHQELLEERRNNEDSHTRRKPKRWDWVKKKKKKNL